MLPQFSTLSGKRFTEMMIIYIKKLSDYTLSLRTVLLECWCHIEFSYVNLLCVGKSVNHGNPVVCRESLYTTFVGIQQLDTVNMTCEDPTNSNLRQLRRGQGEASLMTLWQVQRRRRQGGVFGTQQWLFWNSSFFFEWQINQVKQSTKAQKLLFSESLLEYARLLHPVLRPHSSMRSHGRQIR